MNTHITHPMRASFYAARVSIFLLATLSKSWEPLSVALSQKDYTQPSLYPFAELLVVCEIIKLAVVLPPLLLLRTYDTGKSVGSALLVLVARETIAAFAAPAFFLALVNQALGYAVPRIDPMTYQVFKALSVVAVAVLTKVLMPHRVLGGLRWGALAMLLVGAALCSDESSISSVGATTTHRREWFRGLAAALCGALSFAMQAVWFDNAAERMPGGPLQHMAAMALYGLVVNSVLLVVLHTRWVFVSLLTALHERSPLQLLIFGMSGADAVAAAAIAAADLTMGIFFSVLGANAYSFSRVLALVLSAALADVVLGLSPSPRFVLGASAVATSGWVYHEHERVARWCGGCTARDPGRGAPGYAPVETEAEPAA